MFDLITGYDFRTTRTRCGLTQTDLANALGVTQATIHMIESRSFVARKYQQAFKHYIALLHGWSLHDADARVRTQHIRMVAP